MAMSRVKIICDGYGEVSFVSDDYLSAIEDGVASAKRNDMAFASFIDVLGNRISVVPDRVIAILEEPVSPKDEQEMQAAIAIRLTE